MITVEVPYLYKRAINSKLGRSVYDELQHFSAALFVNHGNNAAYYFDNHNCVNTIKTDRVAGYEGHKFYNSYIGRAAKFARMCTTGRKYGNKKLVPGLELECLCPTIEICSLKQLNCAVTRGKAEVHWTSKTKSGMSRPGWALDRPLEFSCIPGYELKPKYIFLMSPICKKIVKYDDGDLCAIAKKIERVTNAQVIYLKDGWVSWSKSLRRAGGMEPSGEESFNSACWSILKYLKCHK